MGGTIDDICDTMGYQIANSLRLLKVDFSGLCTREDGEIVLSNVIDIIRRPGVTSLSSNANNRTRGIVETYLATRILCC